MFIKILVKKYLKIVIYNLSFYLTFLFKNTMFNSPILVTVTNKSANMPIVNKIITTLYFLLYCKIIKIKKPKNCKGVFYFIQFHIIIK